MTSTQIFFRIIKSFIQYKWRIFGGIISVVMMSVSDVLQAYCIALFFDVLNKISILVQSGKDIVLSIPIVIPNLDLTLYLFDINGKSESFRLIYVFAIVIIVIILVKIVFVYSREYVMSSVQQKVLAKFRINLFDKIVALPVNYFDKNKTGYIMSRITNDVNNLEQSVYSMVEILQNSVYTLVYASALFMTNWQLAVFSIIIFAISGGISRKFGDKIRSYSKDLTNTLAEISAFIQEKIMAIRIVKSFTREEEEKRRFKQKVESNYHYSMKIVRVTALLSPTNELFNTTAVAILVIFCGYLFIQASMTIEVMIRFLILVNFLAKPVKALGESAAKIQKTLVSAGYIFEILDLKTEENKPDAIKYHITKGDVEFKNVSFSYRGNVEALKKINLKIPSGKKVALVGPSGSGKSTLINLIPRFYEIKKGEILIDGIDINKMDLYSLRSQIAIVPQDVILFSGTILSNIAYGKLDASREEIINAAKSANAHEFIEKLENKYDTEVGERGLQLSGGQRQRIAIARAILRNPKLLLLDEATSALDTESELMVKEALNNLMEGRTSFIIAHRLSTIAHCDIIVVLEKGEIVEVGTHEELLKIESGLYNKLHSLQFADK